MIATMLVGCGGGGGDSAPTSPPPPATPTETLVATYTVVPARVVRSALCEDEVTGLGGCVGINQQPEMPRIIPLDQQVPTDPLVIPFTRRTGTSGQVHTAQTGGTLYEIDARSFAQTKAASSEIGLYVNTVDRSTAIPATSVNPLYQFTTTPPSGGEVDRRVMPWRDGVTRDLELSFEILVKTFRRTAGQTNDQSFAQSHPVIELIDTRSRRNFYLTIGAASVSPHPTRPEDDFSGKDFGVGNAIVSTTFRSNPAFGLRISGQSFVCNTNDEPAFCNAGNTQFRFRLRPEDFRQVLAKARTFDPLLSAELSDYAIDNFSFNNEVSGDAQIGVTLRNYTLSIFAH
ncbi:MAG: hypothetical protein JNN20_01330 [Betaproteobacteria bacterium]|nr:hypothetical protein [Betaproteobacteria bacterium]